MAGARMPPPAAGACVVSASGDEFPAQVGEDTFSFGDRYLRVGCIWPQRARNDQISLSSSILKRYP
ncbi:hypothetical protein ADIAG_02063 [Paeniglutamicibacter gangotriensis Lz1y]|uniref:Uncharacterized protein n=1 Tax=Paeniglutamicibacter gangotriensis Lz1y TaxID=1276920 RepID=M7NA19_9MICC|nr:hypothetical protein ADIAG_02063 [Paeniglutamicibacter gangotriensis Lz1y]